jgi:hypothetical protein
MKNGRPIRCQERFHEICALFNQNSCDVLMATHDGSIERYSTFICLSVDISTTLDQSLYNYKVSMSRGQVERRSARSALIL